jgi:hypothetical protein
MRICRSRLLPPMPVLITLLLAFGNDIGRRQRVAHRR